MAGRGSNVYRFSGRLDELKVYTGSISGRGLGQGLKTLSPPDEPALTGAGAELLDFSGNGHDASAVNGLVNDDDLSQPSWEVLAPVVMAILME